MLCIFLPYGQEKLLRSDEFGESLPSDPPPGSKGDPDHGYFWIGDNPPGTGLSGLQFDFANASTMKVTMTRGAWRTCLLCALALSISSLRVKAQIMSVSLPDECARTAGMDVYSNVFIHEETGDLLGYELAVKRQGNSGADALLYVYEGGEAGEGIPLSGQVSKNRLALKGTWVEHLVEYPSKKNVTEEHHVEVFGTMGDATFRGELTISGMEEDHQHIRLKRVQRTWPCYDRNATPDPT